MTGRIPRRNIQNVQLAKDETPGGTVLERRWSPPQAQNPQNGGRQTRQCVPQPKWYQK